MAAQSHMTSDGKIRSFLFIWRQAPVRLDSLFCVSVAAPSIHYTYGLRALQVCCSTRLKMSEPPQATPDRPQSQGASDAAIAEDSLAMSGPPQAASDRHQSQGASDAVIAVGDRFATFAALEEKIEKFSTANSVQLWKRDARTIETAKKRAGKIASRMPTELKYYHLHYCCIHGGMKFVTSSKGVRKAS